METQGQLVGATRFSRAKVYDQERESPWAFTLTERVPEVFEIPPSDWPEKFSGQSASGISNASGTRSVKVNAQGLSRSCCKLSPVKIPSPQLAAPGCPRMTLDRRNRKHQMRAKNKHVLRQNQRSDKWDVYANTEGNVSFLKYTKRTNRFY